MWIRNSRFVRALAASAALLFAGLAGAAEVALIGVFPGKAAVLSIDGGAPRTIRVGQQAGSVSVVSVAPDRAEIIVDGRRRTLALGQFAAAPGASGGRQSVTLAADAQGHFVADGAINGGVVRFLVDTGATAIAIPASDANRLRIDYRQGRRGTVHTANGPAAAYAVRFDTVRLGGLELHNVEGVVLEAGLPIALLGMSFLNRVEMKREGPTMTLVKRF